MTATDTVETQAEPHRSLLRGRPFRRYWTAQTVSFFGDEVSTLALPLLAVLVLGASPAEMGYLTAARLAPNLFFSLYAGVWVDRQRHRRYVMIATDLGRALLIVSIPVVYAFGGLTLWQLYLVAFLAGTLSTLFEVANSSVFVSLVPRERFVDANSLINGSRALSYVAGPSLGGLLVQVLTAPAALLVDAASYLASAFQLARVAPAEPPPETQRAGQLTAGLRFLAGSRVLWTALAAAATVNFFNYMFSALVVLYATVHLGLSAGLLGAVIGAGAVGALLGSVLTGRIVRLIGIGPSYVVGLVAFPAPLLLVPLAGGPRPVVLLLLFLAEFLAGLGVMVLDIAAGSLQAALIPARLRARVSGATRTLNYGIRPVGALAGGALATLIGVRPTLWIATAGALLGVVWLIGSPLARLRTLPESGDPHDNTVLPSPS
jgi:MFS family permease